MNDVPELDKIRDLYSDNLNANGAISASVGWNSTESQNLRFEKLSSVIEDCSKPLEINDYGCGYGAHLEYLEQCKIPVAQYNGYDLSEPMLNAARKNLAGYKGKMEFYNTSEITTEADYSFASGTFNVRFESRDEEWEKFIRLKLNELDHHSRKGFAFNLLSTYVDWKESHLYYGDPCYWFDFCKKNYSKKVALLHDYELFEWTIRITK